jgi:hypothetical protein
MSFFKWLFCKHDWKDTGRTRESLYGIVYFHRCDKCQTEEGYRK